jgi:hypothetical protein
MVARTNAPHGRISDSHRLDCSKHMVNAGFTNLEKTLENRTSEDICAQATRNDDFSSKLINDRSRTCLSAALAELTTPWQRGYARCKSFRGGFGCAVRGFSSLF